MKTRMFLAVALLVVAVASAGCVREPLPPNMRIETGFGDSTATGSTTASGSERTVELDGATDAKVSLSMGAGEMSVSSGDTSALAEASFDYRDSTFEPNVSYDVAGTTGTLVISQPNVKYKFGTSGTNSWDVKLAKGVPMDFTLHMGAGSSDVDLSEVAVRNLKIQLGAGETTIDLTGPRTANVAGDIQAGVGQLTIKLPKDVGVKVNGRQDGVGSFSADGFKAYGNSFVNDAWGKTPVSIELNVMRGVGEVRLELQ